MALEIRTTRAKSMTTMPTIVGMLLLLSGVFQLLQIKISRPVFEWIGGVVSLQQQEDEPPPLPPPSPAAAAQAVPTATGGDDSNSNNGTTVAATATSTTTTTMREVSSTTTTTTTTTTSSDRRRLPILYLHPGPPKTATTTTQKILTDYKVQLRKDGIRFLGKTFPKGSWDDGFPHPSYCSMYQRYKERADNNSISFDCMNRTSELLDSYWEAGHDIVMSCEVIGAMFSEKRQLAATGLNDWVELLSTRKKKKKKLWDVRILVGYRPYFDFLKSSYNQEKKFNWRKPKLNRWSRKGYIERVLPLGDYLAQRKRRGWSKVKGWPRPLEIVNLFRRQQKIIKANITVLDITTHGDSLTVWLLCKFLEGATAACNDATAARENDGGSASATTGADNAAVAAAAEAAPVENSTKATAAKATTQQQKQKQRQNTAVILDYDMLATAAAQRGLLNVTYQKRSDVARKVQARVEKSIQILQQHGINSSSSSSSSLLGLSDVFPMVCPSDDVAEDLYKQSLIEEMELFPDRSPHWKTRILFNETLQKKTLCNVDVNRVLDEDESWIEFFRSL